MKHRLSTNDRRLLRQIEKSNSHETKFDPVDLLNLLEKDDIDKNSHSDYNDNASPLRRPQLGRQRRHMSISDSEQYHRGENVDADGGGGSDGSRRRRTMLSRDILRENGGRWPTLSASSALRQLISFDNDTISQTDSASNSNSGSFSSRSTRSLFSNYVAWAQTITEDMTNCVFIHRWVSQQKYKDQHKWSIGIGAIVFFLLISFLKISRSPANNDSLGIVLEQSIIMNAVDNDVQSSKSFLTICDRVTPFDPEVSSKFRTDWPRENKILVLRTDGGKFGHIGSQMISLLHAFDYARENMLHLGIFYHSWAMDVLSTMFYESESFEALEYDLMQDFGVILIRRQVQLEKYDDVISKNAKQLYFHSKANQTRDYWREVMQYHISIMQQLYLRYNRGYGYIHSGLRANDVCATLSMLFRDRIREMKYSVSKLLCLSSARKYLLRAMEISDFFGFLYNTFLECKVHFNSLDNTAAWRLEKIADKTGMSVEGVASMSADYVTSIMLPLGMLENPIILITDGNSPAVEQELFNNPIIGPELIVLSETDGLDGAQTALAVLSDVYIGNPASETSGFIARSRMALGYSAETTQLFRRKREHTWFSICNEACVFNPEVMGPWS